MIVVFCKKHELIILSDLAYSEIYFDNNPPPSILQINGAKSIAVEFTSMSKTYAMPGWRIGFAVGNDRIISALIRVKSYLDYGAYTPIQVAAAAALNGPQDCIEEIRLCYKSRRDILIKSFANSGWDIPEPQSSMFAWAPIPEQFKDLGSIEFSKLLLKKTKVAVSPGVGFGSEGDGHVRIALVENEHRVRQAARNQRMKNLGTPDPFDDYTTKLQKNIKKSQKNTDQGLRTISSMNPSERAARGIGGGSSSGGSTEGSGGAGGSRVSGGKKVTDFTTGKEVERKVSEKGGSVEVYNQRKGKDFVKNSRKVNMDTSGIMGQGDKSGQALRPVNNTRIQNIKATSAIALDKYTKFAQKNPALGFATYDIGKGIIGKIMKTRMTSVQGGKAGFRSAGG